MLLEAVRFIRFTMGADVAGCARFKRLENQVLIQSLQTRWPMSCNPEVFKHVPPLAPPAPPSPLRRAAQTEEHVSKLRDCKTSATSFAGTGSVLGFPNA